MPAALRLLGQSIENRLGAGAVAVGHVRRGNIVELAFLAVQQGNGTILPERRGQPIQLQTEGIDIAALDGVQDDTFFYIQAVELI